jgi:hypothetical protein
MGHPFSPEVQSLLDRVGSVATELAIANDELRSRECNADRIAARIKACTVINFDGDWKQLCHAAKLSQGGIAREIGDYQEAVANAAIRGGVEHHNKLAEAERALRAAAYHAGAEPDYIGPFRPSEWAKRFKISLSTFTRMVKDGKLRVRSENTKRVWIHPDDVQRYSEPQS